MFKKYEDKERNNLYYVGQTADIKALYKSIVRHSDECGIESYFQDSPKFSSNKAVYALCIEYTERTNYITVVNSDTMMLIICDGEVEEVQ